jgi:hypothetical protein
MKKQKESARIARQQEKLTRKLARAAETPPEEGAGAATEVTPQDTPATETTPPGTSERNGPR